MEEQIVLQPLLLSEAPYKTWLGEVPPEEVPRLDTEGVVDELANMFPQIERAVIEAVVESSSNSLERALEALLAISDSDPANVAAISTDGLTAEERQIKEDELLALQLFQQFAAEERSRGGGSSSRDASVGADRMFEAIQQEGSAAHAQFQQQPEGVRDAFLKQLTKMRQRQAAAAIKGAAQAPPHRRETPLPWRCTRGMRLPRCSSRARAPPSVSLVHAIAQATRRSNPPCSRTTERLGSTRLTRARRNINALALPAHPKAHRWALHAQTSQRWRQLAVCHACAHWSRRRFRFNFTPTRVQNQCSKAV
jgi:hypothetical protein